MISGSDITLDTMDHLRMAVRGEEIPIHFDYHGLTTGINADHERYRRPLPEWRRWAFMNDSIQLNEEEAAGLTVEGLGEEQTVGHLLTLGVKAVVVTRGSRGASVFTSEHKHILRKDVGGSHPSVANTVGSGDVFGAAFLFRTVQGGHPDEAAQFAHDVAARLSDVRGG
jgi:sugar/nucleoside kinase (ribokinase family)